MSCLTKTVRCLPVSRTATRFFCSTSRDQAARELSRSRILATMNVLGKIFSRQVNVYVNNRLRRANQLYNKYHQGFFGKMLHSSFFTNFFRRAATHRSRFLLSAAAVFSFPEEGIPDSEVERCIEEFKILKKEVAPQDTPVGAEKEARDLRIEEFTRHLREEGYECVVCTEHLHIWRKSEPELANYKYKMFGTFKDITAKNFFDVQCNLDYRRIWDKLVVELTVVDKDPENEVIYWQMRYPFPMSSRDYVFVRRNLIDQKTGCLIVVSHATSHPDCPPRSKIVRVDQYMSDIIISPHGSPDENGFDYLLTYYDDPHSSFPSPVYTWMATSGVHDYLGRLHQATKDLAKSPIHQSAQVAEQPKKITSTQTSAHGIPIKQYA